MASSMPIPDVTIAPRRPSDSDSDQASIALDGVVPEAPSNRFYDFRNLSPAASMENLRRGSSASAKTMPMNMFSPISTLSPSTTSLTESPGTANSDYKSPFSFQTETYTVGNRSPQRSNVGQRRGHKYKHSSVSHQIFQEPEPRAPLRLPASLPVPTMKEGWKSMTTGQTMRACWCVCHLLVAAFVQWSAQGSLAMTALSHLIFYDAIGAFLCSGVEVLSNFEVWKRASIRQPFGLERSEVLVGFAMSILLLFMGFDLISHNVSHILESHGGGHEAHREHKHEARVSAGSVDLVSLVAVASTLISAVMLKNHARIAKSLRIMSLSSLSSVLSNPSHLLTIGCSGLLLLMPLLSFDMYTWMDQALSTAMALAMCILGVRLVKNLGGMLLMSYGGPGVNEVVRDIETDPAVTAVEEAKFWQVHYGLCIANLKLRARGTEESLGRLRERVQTMVRNKLGGGYGKGGQHWEVSTQLTLEKD